MIALKKTFIFHLRKFARLFGYDLIKVRRKPGAKDEPYGFVYPSASYSPWMMDGAFENAFQRFSPHSLVDRYRSYELWELVAQATKLDGAFIEIGVWRGGSGLLIAERLRLLGASRPVFLCDTFEGIVKSGAKDNSVTNGMYSDTSAEQVSERAVAAGLNQIVVLKGIFPDESGAQLENERFSFCHIDVDTYQSCKDTLDWLWPRIVPAGIVVFDDYGFRGTKGVAAYLEEIKGRPGHTFIHNLNGHGLLIKG